MLTLARAPDVTAWLTEGGPPAAGRAEAAIWIALALAALAAFTVAAAIVSLRRRDRAVHGPALRRLAAGLGVSPRQRRLLVRIARASRLPHAGSLLVSRGCFDDAASPYVERVGLASRVDRLRAAVFGPSPH